MEFKIAREEFLKGLQKVQGIVDTKGAMPILSNILIKTQPSGIDIFATDLDIGIKGSYGAKIISKGSATVSGRKLHEIVRELPDEEIHLKSDKENNWINITCKKSTFKIACLPAEEYPAFPAYKEEKDLCIEIDLLKEMLRKTNFSISTDETRYTLNGVLLESEGKDISMVGTDGHRLACIKKSNGFDKKDKVEIIIPKKAQAELLKILEAGDSDQGNGKKTINISVEKNHAAFKVDKMILVTRLIDGRFPNYRQVIPEDNNNNVVIDSELFLHALRRVAILADEKSRMVKFGVQKNLMTLVSDNSELGEAREEIDVEYKGNDITIGLNAKYVMDILNVINVEKIVFKLKDADSSCLITPTDNENYRCIVMPMRI